MLVIQNSNTLKFDFMSGLYFVTDKLTNREKYNDMALLTMNQMNRFHIEFPVKRRFNNT